MRNPPIRTNDCRPYLPATILLFLLLSTVTPLRAQIIWNEEQKLTANDAVAGIGFGDAVAVGPGALFVGATANGLANLSAGAVYVLSFNENDGMWQHWQKLTADDGALDDRFGWSIDHDEGVVIVGAPDDDDAGNLSGSAYVFRFDGDSYVQEQKLVADDGSASDRFGRSVAVYGNVAIVGAPDADGSGGPTGAAYVFRYEDGSWHMEQKLQPGTFSTIAGFGADVAAYEDRLLVGVPRSGPGAQNLGSAYVYRYDANNTEWVEEAVLSASDQDPQDMFGASVDLYDDFAVIGAPQDEEVAAFAGSAYIFQWDGNAWQEKQKLLADDGAEDDRFGTRVSITSEGVAAVGAPSHDQPGTLSAGAVYIYSMDGPSWSQSQELAASDPGIGDHFGEAVAILDDRVVIGASNNDDGGESAGSAYVFKLGPSGTAIEDIPDDLSVATLRGYPNPFADRVELSYELTEPGQVRVAVFDVLGRLVAQLADEQQAVGRHTVALHRGSLPAGLYLARLETARGVKTIALVKGG